jgi:hypothetical protein
MLHNARQFFPVLLNTGLLIVGLHKPGLLFTTYAAKCRTTPHSAVKGFFAMYVCASQECLMVVL